jgi:hypothetical protein
MSQQQMIAELKFLRAENKALKEEKVANQGTIAVQERLMKVEVERGDFYKTAAEKGIQLGGNDIVLQQRYEQEIGMYKDENTRLRSENDKLRNSRNWRTVLGFGVGTGLGYLAGNQVCR